MQEGQMGGSNTSPSRRGHVGIPRTMEGGCEMPGGGIRGDPLRMLGGRDCAIERSGSVNQRMPSVPSATTQRRQDQVHELTLGSVRRGPMFDDFDNDYDF